MRKNLADIDAYVAELSGEKKKLVLQVRDAVKRAAPKATEKISYGMPAFAQDGNLVYFAAFKNHIGFFPMASGVEAFKDQLTEYKTSKGAIQFPLDKPLPLTLIRRIVQFRVKRNQEKAALKSKSKSRKSKEEN